MGTEIYLFVLYEQEWSEFPAWKIKRNFLATDKESNMYRYVDSTHLDFGYKPWDIITKRNDFKWNNLTKIITPSANIGWGAAYQDLRRYYEWLDATNNRLMASRYRPSKGDNELSYYVAINNPEFDKYIMSLYKHILEAKNTWLTLQEAYLISVRYQNAGNSETNIQEKYNRRKNNTSAEPFWPIIENWTNSRIIPRYYWFTKGYVDDDRGCLWNFTLSYWIDSQWEYVSYYDIWDTEGPLETLGIAKKFKIYNRIYINKNE